MALPLLAVSIPAWAQTDCPNGYDCTIVVTGRLPDALGDAAYSITTVAPFPFERIENTLRDVPGLQQFRRSDARSANPTSQGITLRGLGGNASSRALLILDGVPQPDPFGGYISWPGYDALPIAEARIRRGGGSGAEGAGAIAGTIELFSEDVGNLTEVAAAFGSRNSVDADLVFDRKLGQGQLTISGNYARGDGFIPIIKSQRGSVDRSAAYEEAGLAVRFVAPLTQYTQLQANVRAFTDDRERGFAFSENHNDGADASLRLVNRTPGGWQWSALGYIQIRNFDVSFGGVAPDRNSVTRVFEQYAVPSTGVGARFEVRPPLSESAELRIGGDWRRTEGQTKENFFFADNDTPRRSRFAGGTTAAYGAFVEGSLQATDALKLTGGGRVDFWNINDGFRREIELVRPFPGAQRSDEKFVKRSGTEFTGRGGFAYDMTDAVKLRGAAYLGWRLPTLNELFRPFRAGDDATAANEFLVPERLKGAELGADITSGIFTAGVTVYYNQLDQAVANVTLGRGPGVFPNVGFVGASGTYSKRQNLDAIRSTGVEADLRLDLGGGMSINAAYAFTDAQVDASGTAIALNGLRPAQVAKHSASAGFKWSGESGVMASLTSRYIGSQYEDDLNSQKLSDAFTLDGAFAYPLTHNFAIEARAENLFNSRVEAALSSDGTIERTYPRTFWIGLRARIE